MSIPKPVYNPPFNVTRASHSVLTVKDLAVSRNFYVDLLGFIVSDEDRDALCLRGVAEACHHSLVLKRARGEPQAERVRILARRTEPRSFCSCFCSARATPTISCSRPGQGRGSITPRSQSRNPLTSSTSAIWPPRWAFAANIEFGPGRHGPGHALFVYLRDPDGHRIELFNTHYQVMDIENEPVRWDASHAMKRRWQLPARRQWFVEASRFAGVEPREPARKGDPMSLEKFIAAGMR
jgi:catechol 2,3-dioxygenase-like lactoylglutathione lyase family enzyme